uniref:mitogen-activated protein kinase kinase n=1 Tax=Guillardia theta TaxID=55529 RepID=A0A7S4PJ77_GUITH|mmetsp:Transcript_52364/g.162548  ORF Transcript_52364/g.162548 Transcript_52364/m.162548 type:complete len:352 (+) Transcript_52364:194-1249(+)
MKRRPNFKVTAIKADEDEEHTAEMKSSLAFTAGGSLLIKDFRLNLLGMKSGIGLDEIELGKELGRGASSVVLKARHLPTDQDIAVKKLLNIRDKQLRKQLVAEMQFLKPMLAESPCPFLVSLFDGYYDPKEDATFLVMEFCHFGALDNLIVKKGAPEEDALSFIMRCILLGLSYLYRKGIVHRDMKPANCLVAKDGIVKISDFGSSRRIDSELNQAVSPEQMASTFTGTTRYLSPERLQGEPYSWPADIWCAGMIMLELAYGKHPYEVCFGQDSSFIALIEYAVRRETPNMPAGYSSDAEDFKNLCLMKDPCQRPSSIYLVNEEEVEDSHPFILKYCNVTSDVILNWVGAE